MKEYPIEKYRFYIGKNKVIAISTYEGKTVKGIAKCNPEDTFDVEKGKVLAAARCNHKIAKKRADRAYIKLQMAIAESIIKQEYAYKMNKYYQDACIAMEKARIDTENLLKDM